MLGTFKNELPSQYADRLGLEYTCQVDLAHKKKLGQFFTPLEVAKFIAENVVLQKTNKIKILDPGCGIGILSCALIERIVSHNSKIREIELLAFETDIEIIPYAEECLNYLRIWLKSKRIIFKHLIAKNDFILANSKILNNEDEDENNLFDIVITNPPYFKINKTDSRAIEAKAIISGQTNIYSIFLILSANFLKPGGQLVFITPRSFASGSYFRLFRQNFFKLISLNFIHLFESRKETFKRDNILQESIIVCGTKKNKNLSLKINESTFTTVSRSIGIGDQSLARKKVYKEEELIDFSSFNKVLYIPTSDIEDKIISIFKSWKNNLMHLGYDVSTGPVVAYRSKEDILFDEKLKVVPLIWIHNVEKMKLSWPILKKEKGQYIKLTKSTLSRLIPNKNYVFVKRFSTKDDESRLIATPYFSKNFKLNYIGIENHLNYIYKFLNDLDEMECLGIAALLNSKIFDTYFRTFNGNTNVSVSDLKNIPFPNIEIIKALGKLVKIKGLKEIDQKFIDKNVNLLLDLNIT